MASTGRKIQYLLCLAVFLYYVNGVSGRDHRLLVSAPKEQDEVINATTGSNITLVCVIPPDIRKFVVWYKAPETESVADMEFKDKHCEFIRNNNTRLFIKGCNNTEFRILIRNIQEEDEGQWYCHSKHGSSQRLWIKVQIHNVASSTADQSISQGTPTVETITSLLEKKLNGYVKGVTTEVHSTGVNTASRTDRDYLVEASSSAFGSSTTQGISTVGGKTVSTTQSIPTVGGTTLSTTQGIPTVGGTTVSTTQGIPRVGDETVSTTQGIPRVGDKTVSTTQIIPTEEKATGPATKGSNTGVYGSGLNATASKERDHISSTDETTTTSKEKLTSTSIITEDHTEVLITEDVGTSNTNQRKDSRSSRPTSGHYSIPAVAGSIGTFVLLAVIVAIISSALRAWQYSHTDSDSDQDSLGGLTHNYNVYGWHIIGEGTEASELKILPSKDSLTDVHSVVEMSVLQAGKESPEALTPDENVSGMYSVAENCVELQGARTASTTDLNGLFDVYSVVQKSPKCWTEEY